MRYLTREIARALQEESRMVFIAGPRQVGKTTLAKYLLQTAAAEDFYFNWDVESHRKGIIKNPESFWQKEIPGTAPQKQRIVLD